MNIPIFDVPLLLLLGIVWGYIYAKKLVENHPDSHYFLRHILILIFFANIIASAIGIIQPWGMEKFSVAVNHWIGVFYVLSYPMWFWLGNEIFFLLWGKTPQEGGLTWVLTIKDTTKPFKPAWKSPDKKDME